MNLMKHLGFLLLAFLLLSFPTNIYAQENWVIENFDSAITLQTDGKVQIVETIDVDFGSLNKHGIFRDLPYIYQNSDGSKLYTEIKVENVTNNSAQTPFETSKSGNFLQIKIGDPDKTISGKQSYEISYTASGILTSFADHDELYWNVTGNSWEVPIRQASSTVILPSEGIRQVTCFEGSSGSTDPCIQKQDSASSATFESSTGLNPGAGLTIVVGYTKGLVPIITVPPPKTVWDNLFSPINIIAFLAALLIGLGSAVKIWFSKGRDLWERRRFLYDPNAKQETMPLAAHETIVVEFEPPEKLRPAEVGVLMDEQADTLDVSATIIDLATKGYLTITEEEKSWLFGKVDYILTKTEKDTKELAEYESELLYDLFEEGSPTKVSKLKNKFYTKLKKVKALLYKDVADKKFFAGDPDKVRNKYLILGIIWDALASGLIFLAFMVANSFFLAIGVGLAIGGVFWIIFSRFMPRRTAVGRELYRRSRGYELFISTAEKYRQRFFEKKNMFNEILPYAIVFGLTEKFAKALKDMGIEPSQPSWYSGTGPFNAAVFGSSINSFSSSFSSAIASSPSGSGFSGGGGSGGGFGGGGGGSW